MHDPHPWYENDVVLHFVAPRCHRDERERERERVDRWLVADGRPTVIVPGNRKRVITLRIEWKIVRRRSTAFACIPGCVYRPAFAAIPAVSMLHG